MIIGAHAEPNHPTERGTDGFARDARVQDQALVAPGAADGELVQAAFSASIAYQRTQIIFQDGTDIGSLEGKRDMCLQ
jgi:hypothetical protein